MKNYTKGYLFMSMLTFIGGFLDIYTFITRGGIFANTQTTNLAKLGYFIATEQFANGLQCIIPILSCILGGIVSTILMKKGKNELYKNLLIFELLILIIIGFVRDPKWNMLVNCVLSFITSFQLNLFRKYGNLAHNTTISTGNLRQVGELVADAIMGKKKREKILSMKYATLVFMFVIGALVATLLTSLFDERSIWFCGIVLIGLLMIGSYIDKQEKKQYNFLKETTQR